MYYSMIQVGCPFFVCKSYTSSCIRQLGLLLLELLSIQYIYKKGGT